MVKELVSRDNDESMDLDWTLTLLLARFGSEVPITEDIFLLAASSPYSNIIQTIMKEKRLLNLQQVWERLWQCCCGFNEGISDILLESNTPLHISTDLLEKISNPETKIPNGQDSSDGENSFYPESTYSIEAPDDKMKIEHDFLARLIRFLVERNIPIPQEAMAIILERGHLKTISAVLDHNPHIRITNELLNTARKNLDFYDVMWLLYIFRYTPGLEAVGNVIHWPTDTRECLLPGCSAMHSPTERTERRDSSWYYGEPGYWTV